MHLFRTRPQYTGSGRRKLCLVSTGAISRHYVLFLAVHFAMSKVAKSFRLDPVAVEHLAELTKLTGSSQAAIIEQSLAVYRSLLVGGLAGPRRLLTSTTPPTVKAAGFEPEPTPARPQRPASQRLSEARGAARRTISRQLPQPAPEKSEKVPLTPYQLQAKGNVYTFEFPVEEIPPTGSLACPCASGEIFARCHNKEFKKALAAGITERG